MPLTPEERQRKIELLTRKKELLLERKALLEQPAQDVIPLEESKELVKKAVLEEQQPRIESGEIEILEPTREQKATEAIKAGIEERAEKLETGEFEETETIGEDVEKSIALLEQGIKQGATGIKDIVKSINPVADENLVERAERAFSGVVDVIQGGVGAAVSPLPAILPDIAEKPLVAVAKFLGNLGDKGIAAVIELGGGDPNSETALKTREMASTLSQFLGFKGIGKGLKEAPKFLEKSAQKSLEKVLAPTKEKFKVKTEQVVEELAKEKLVSPTRKALLQKTHLKLQEAGEAIDKFIDEKGIKGETPKKQFIDILEEAKNELKVGEVVVEQAQFNVIEGMQEVLNQFPDKIPNTELRNLRQIWDKSIAKKGGFDVNKSPEVLAEIDFKKMVTNSIREELAKTHPKLAELNKKFSFYKKVVDVLEATKKRTTGQGSGLSKAIFTATGFGAGALKGVTTGVFTAAAVAGLVSLFRSTGYRTLSAALKQSFAEALTTGNKVLLNETLQKISKKIPIKVPIQKKEEK